MLTTVSLMLTTVSLMLVTVSLMLVTVHCIGMETSMKTIAKEWRPCRAAFEGMCDGFATAFAQDGNPDHTLMKELRRILLMGVVSNAAHTHLLQNIGEAHCSIPWGLAGL